MPPSVLSSWDIQRAFLSPACKLDASARAVLNFLWFAARGSCSCTAPDAWVGQGTGLSPRAVRTARAKLRKAGFITWEHRTCASGVVNEYTLDVDPLEALLSRPQPVEHLCKTPRKPVEKPVENGVDPQEGAAESAAGVRQNLPQGCGGICRVGNGGLNGGRNGADLDYYDEGTAPAAPAESAPRSSAARARPGGGVAAVGPGGRGGGGVAPGAALASGLRNPGPPAPDRDPRGSVGGGSGWATGRGAPSAGRSPP